MHRGSRVGQGEDGAGCGDAAQRVLAQHEAIVAAVPQAKLVVFENSGHMAPIEAPEAVTAALRDWLAAPA